MSILKRTVLEALFADGTWPDGQAFADFIASYRHKWDTTRYVYAGPATPTTNPGIPTEQIYYCAIQAGTYTNFSSFVVNPGELCFLRCDIDQDTGAVTWSADVLYTGTSLVIQRQAAPFPIVEGDNIVPYPATFATAPGSIIDYAYTRAKERIMGTIDQSLITTIHFHYNSPDDGYLTYIAMI